MNSALKSQFQSTETMLQEWWLLHGSSSSSSSSSVFSISASKGGLSVFSSLCFQSFPIRGRRWQQVLQGRRRRRFLTATEQRGRPLSPGLRMSSFIQQSDPKILYAQLLIESSRDRDEIIWRYCKLTFIECKCRL